MPTRILLLSLLIPAIIFSTGARAGNLDESSPEVGNAEAARLYERANDYVSSMKEGSYSYAYLQFYWKRAQSNLDRIRRVYPDSPTAKALARGDLKIGPYPLDYFKERVLYNLEVKQLGAFEDVNCAIFLYSLNPKRRDPTRETAMSAIVEVLSRRQRWGEALRFPVLDDRRHILLSTVFRVAAFDDHQDIVKQMLDSASAADIESGHFYQILAEALALRGAPREELFNFVLKHPEDSVKQAALKGVIEREILIARAQLLHVPIGEAIATVHVRVMQPSLRDDVHGIAAKLFGPQASGAAPQLDIYDASTGHVPARTAGVEAHLAYQHYLADLGKLDELRAYASRANLNPERRHACELNVIQLLAAEGRSEASARLRKDFADANPEQADEAALAEFRGHLESLDHPFVAHSGSFADLPIKDPCVMATAIMEWSLSPSRSQRGATPWDAVVLRFAGGFDNLPLPKSSSLIEAASTMKPY